MSMIGEFLHEDMAHDLAKVLIEAADDPKWGDIRSAAKGFARDTIYPLYKAHLSDVYGSVSWQDLANQVEEIYGPKENKS